MISQLVGFTALLATASAGLATSYALGGLDGGHGGIGLIGLGGGGLGGLGGGLVGHGGHETVVDYHTPAKYEFKYGVADGKTGDKKQQSEVRVGDVVKGEYSLAEPDGTIRVVKYTADKHNGFNAVVSRIGHAAHPQVVLHKAIVPVAHGIGLGGHGIGIGLGGLGGGLGGLGGLGGHGGY